MTADSAGLDGDTVIALREILADPSLAVTTTAEGPDGPRLARLREAVDHLVTIRAGAAAVTSPEAGRRLLTSLDALDPGLAEVLHRHVAAVRLLLTLEPGRARNAVLGDVGRGDLVALASGVRSWTWRDGAAHPLRSADGRIGADDSPGLYDTVLAWSRGIGGLIAIPTHRLGVSWRRAGPTWDVTLAGTTFHADELIPLDRDPISREEPT